MEALKCLVETYKARGKEICCSLIFDEMSIRKHLQWSDSRKEFLGPITYGFRSGCEEVQLATNAIVFMLNGINVPFQMPIAFHFIETLSGIEKANLLQLISTAIHDCGARIVSITFDGFSTNFSMCEELNASFDLSDYRPYIFLPGNERKVYIILDPSHMEKLARNCVAGNAFLTVENGRKIEWRFFESLEKLRVERNFALTHKMNKKHMQWKNAKMSVRLAVQTLSDSVADSMQYLMDKSIPEFLDASATIKFVRIMNNIFDVMNTKTNNSSSSTIFKNAINPANQQEVFDYFEDVIEYFKTIKLPDGNFILSARTKTAFKGFIMNMVNLKYIYKDCVESGIMDYLTTFVFSQDHVESFFGRIRSLNGFNDNPTIEQFCAAFRKIVVNNEIKCSVLSNCVDSLNILNVSSFRKSIQPIPNDEKITEFEAILDNDQHCEDKTEIENCEYLLDDLESASVAYTAGWIEMKIESSNRFLCDQCMNVFEENDKIDDGIQSSKSRIPCKTTFKICRTAHQFIKIFEKDPDYKYTRLLYDVMREIDFANAFSRTNFQEHESHKYYFIKPIVEEYIRIQVIYTAKKVTLKEQKVMLRKKLLKIIHFCNQ